MKCAPEEPERFFPSASGLRQIYLRIARRCFLSRYDFGFGQSPPSEKRMSLLEVKSRLSHPLSPVERSKGIGTLNLVQDNKFS
jgi:hypothetical protein